MGTWKVIVPEARINWVKNPIALGAANYTAYGTATITRDLSFSYFGYKNYKIVTTNTTSGINLTLQALSNNAHYITYRVHSTSSAGVLRVSIDAGVNWNTPTLLYQEDDWLVYGTSVPAILCSGSTTLTLNYAGSGTWYVGHVQVEIGAYETTPIYGSLKGFTEDGYKWYGENHASMSIRNGWERSGGKIVDLEDTYNFRVLYGQGIGMPPIQHNVQPLALLPGALYAGHKVLPRNLDLMAAPKTNTTTGIAQARSNFINAIKPDLVSPEQPVVFRYTGANANKPVNYHGVYDSGMEFQISAGRIDKPVARFICYDPFAYGVHTEGKELNRQTPVTNANYVLRRIDGLWYNISSAFNGTVSKVVKGIDGTIFIAGAFTNVGDANGDYIVKWNPITQTLSSMGTGIQGGQVMDMLVAPNGDLYVSGSFTGAGGVANTAYVARWSYSASAWQSLSTTSIGAGVRTMAWGHNGTLYLGGDFTNAGGDALADHFCYYTGTTWASVDGLQGPDGTVYKILQAPDGTMYVGGLYTTVNGITVNNIAQYNPYATSPSDGYRALGTGLSGACLAMAIDKNGNLYIGGTFTTANGVTVNNTALWSGVTFIPLGTGTDATVLAMEFDRNNDLWVGGHFLNAGGLTVVDRMAIWGGTTWRTVPVNLPGDATVTCFCFPTGDDVYIGYDTAGTATASLITDVTVSNAGSHSSYPKIGISRSNDGTSLRVLFIRNETTRHNLYLNYDLQKGEELTIDTAPGKKSVYSNYYGPIMRAILRGSDFGNFCLLGGLNKISVFITEAGTPSVLCWIEYKVTHWSADTAV